MLLGADLSTGAGGHLGHLLAGAAAALCGAVAVLTSVLRDRHRRSSSGPTVPRGAGPPVPSIAVAADGSILGWLAVAAAGAATVHGAVVREHFGESTALGVFFGLLAISQYGYAVLIVRFPSVLLVRAGLAANAGVVALWAFTRLIGIPFGIAGGATEQVGIPDLLATGFETAAVVTAIVALRHGARSWPRREAMSPAQRIAAVCAIAVTSAAVATLGPN